MEAVVVQAMCRAERQGKSPESGGFRPAPASPPGRWRTSPWRRRPSAAAPAHQAN